MAAFSRVTRGRGASCTGQLLLTRRALYGTAAAPCTLAPVPAVHADATAAALFTGALDSSVRADATAAALFTLAPLPPVQAETTAAALFTRALLPAMRALCSLLPTAPVACGYRTVLPRPSICSFMRVEWPRYVGGGKHSDQAGANGRRRIWSRASKVCRGAPIDGPRREWLISSLKRSLAGAKKHGSFIPLKRSVDTRADVIPNVGGAIAAASTNANSEARLDSNAVAIFKIASFRSEAVLPIAPDACARGDPAIFFTFATALVTPVPPLPSMRADAAAAARFTLAPLPPVRAETAAAARFTLAPLPPVRAETTAAALFTRALLPAVHAFRPLLLLTTDRRRACFLALSVGHEKSKSR
jgi:hypothetical protein